MILSGGPESVYEVEDFRAPSVVFELGVPVLGICYGMQTMAAQLGGKVRTRPLDALFKGIEDRRNAQGHGTARRLDEPW
jgi:GMP synthase (glutamine-hydrolysing)